MIQIKKVLPHIAIIFCFLAITLVYFSPVIEGKLLKQGDVVNYRGSSKEITDYRTKTGEEALWTNSMFGGMPAYQISVLYPNNWIPKITRVLTLGLPHPASIFLLYLIGFYILLLCLQVDFMLAAVGSIAFAFSSYFLIIIEAGHNTKAIAIGLMAPVIGGVILTYRGKVLLGLAITALFLSMELAANHLQITYYLATILLLVGLTEAYLAIKNKTIAVFLKNSVWLCLVSVLAVGPNITNLLATEEYGKESTRGKSELTNNKEDKTSGLDKSYATDWSYGVGETFTLLIPNFKGGSSASINSKKGNKDALKNVDPQYREYIGNVNQYWGDQPFTSGPTYAGAIVCFLFVLGLLLVEGPIKWWILGATIVSVTLAWGKNFMELTEFFLDNVPGYNKFRAVSMILVIAELTIPLLAILAVKKIVENPQIIKERAKAFYIALGSTAGLCLLMYLLPTMFIDFFAVGEYDNIIKQLKESKAGEEQISIFLSGVEEARKSIFCADAIRSFFFIVIAAGAVLLFSTKKISTSVFYILLGAFILVDMWSVDKRYLNADNFVQKVRMETPFVPSQADNIILQDKEPGYRVLNIAVSTFNDASTSYFHRSIGGYHGAKLKRYQELIEFQLQKNIQNTINTLKATPTDSSIKATIATQNALNMLNTKYIIYNPEAAPILNTSALGSAWFVNEYKLVENADKEMAELGSINPRTTALVDKRFEKELGLISATPSIGSIKLINYEPNHLVYESNNTEKQLAVFSEIYYNKGWNAYVDGKQESYVRANYVLRAMVVPAGKHKIEFKFEPTVYASGQKIALVSSILLILFVLLIFIKEVKEKI